MEAQEVREKNVVWRIASRAIDCWGIKTCQPHHRFGTITCRCSRVFGSMRSGRCAFGRPTGGNSWSRICDTIRPSGVPRSSGPVVGHSARKIWATFIAPSSVFKSSFNSRSRSARDIATSLVPLAGAIRPRPSDRIRTTLAVQGSRSQLRTPQATPNSPADLRKMRTSDSPVGPRSKGRADVGRWLAPLYPGTSGDAALDAGEKRQWVSNYLNNEEIWRTLFGPVVQSELPPRQSRTLPIGWTRLRPWMRPSRPTTSRWCFKRSDPCDEEFAAR